MQKYIYLTLTFFCLMVIKPIHAQQHNAELTQELTSFSSQQAHINKLLENYIEENKENRLLEGYRLQLYYNNKGQTSKVEAEELAVKILQKLPNMATYVTYQSPFWRLSVGDARSYPEIKRIEQLIAEEFPELKNQGTILRGQKIQLPPL